MNFKSKCVFQFNARIPIIIFAWSLLINTAVATTWTVDDDGIDYPSSDFNNIQHAVNASSDGDTILVYPGTYTTSSVFADAVVEIPYGKSLSIQGVSGSAVTIIDAQNEYGRGGLVSNSSLSIEGFTIVNGSASYYGGGITMYGGGIVRNCIINGNSSGWDGGGIFNGGSTTVSIVDSTISNNQSIGGYGGGIAIDMGGTATIENCSIIANTSYRRGGGVYINESSQTSITNSIIESNSNNDSFGRGGGVYCGRYSVVTLGESTINNNTSITYGGGIYVYRSNLTAVNCSINGNNTAEDGGAVNIYGISTASFTGCLISDNNAGISGGGLLCHQDSIVELEDSIVCGNTPSNFEGAWNSISNVCVAVTCDDVDGNGMPDACDVPDDGIHVPGDYPTIQSAIDAASEGDIIYVGPGTWTGTGNSVVNFLGKGVTVQSLFGAQSTIIDGENIRRGVICMNDETAASVLNGFTITGGLANEGGGIFLQECSPTITYCIIDGNNAQDTYAHGGGIFCWRGNPSISNCTISDNTSTGDYADGGGLHFNESSVVISNCTISRNMSLSGGGISVLAGTPLITNCIFTENWTIDGGLGDGGGIFIHAGNPTVSDCQFTNNTAYWGGGGIGSVTSSTVVTGCIFSNNSARNGGGIHFELGTEQVSNCSFSENEAVQGGGLYCGSGSLSTISNCTISQNDASDGGGLFCFRSDTTTNVVGSQIEFNTAGSGAGVTSGNGNLQLVDCTIKNNQLNKSPGWGGGVDCYNQGNVLLQNCIIQGNWVNLPRGYTQNRGGGLFCMQGSSIELEGCTIISNGATLGDGLLAEDSSIISWIGINTVQFDDLICEDAGTSMKFTADSICTAGEEVRPSEEGTLIFDIDSVVTPASLQVEDLFVIQGGLAITNESGSFFALDIGDYIPVIQTENIVGGLFGSVVFPSLPDGMGMQLTQSTALGGSGNEIGVEVIEVDDADFDIPFSSDLDYFVVDMVSFDADGDGADEIAILYDGTPGFVAAYSMSPDSPPMIIDGLIEYVGNTPVDIDAGDINGDGLDDLLITNSNDSTVTVLITEEANDGSLYFSAYTHGVSGSGAQTLTCGALIDWDGANSLDAVVGVDVSDTFQEDALQVLQDMSGTPTIGPRLEIPLFQLSENLWVSDPPTCVDGGNQTSTWGFVGGTRYGRVYRSDESTNVLTTILELGISRIASVEALDLDDNSGDGILDLMIASDEAQTIYLFQGNDAESDGFESAIPISVSEAIQDVLAMDVDDDGDMDIISAAPEADNPLLLLRNDGSVGNLLPGSLGGNVWSMQNLNSGNSPKTIVSGTLGGKDEKDDWIVGGGDESEAFRGGIPVSSMEQTNVMISTSCIADLSGDGEVSIHDLLELIAAWGLCESCPADFDLDGEVDVADLLVLIAAWGPCSR